MNPLFHTAYEGVHWPDGYIGYPHPTAKVKLAEIVDYCLKVYEDFYNHRRPIQNAGRKDDTLDGERYEKIYRTVEYSNYVKIMNQGVELLVR